ncbi:MAG: hydrogenase maturation nickel metallochaperone HypA [Planctomycetota bacterium]|nr:MAG: hydrogenase maturation nickel metallochaperone HypA [Planctomycetota bacterium]
MHELSIAHSLVTTATDALDAERASGSDPLGRVKAVHLRLGRLAGVVRDALEFCYDLVTEDTLLAGSQLVIHDIDVVVFCNACQAERTLPGIQRFRCPECDKPTGDIRHGRELELEYIELE